jgi:hypothetical protein
MQLLTGEEAHQMFGLQPDALVSDSSPEEHKRFALEFATGMGQLIELGGLADVHAADMIHRACPPSLSVRSQPQLNAQPSPAWSHHNRRPAASTFCDLQHRPELRGFSVFHSSYALYANAYYLVKRQGLKPSKTRLTAQAQATIACGGFNAATILSTYLSEWRIVAARRDPFISAECN